MTEFPTRYSSIYGFTQQTYVSSECTAAPSVCNSVYNPAADSKLYYQGNQYSGDSSNLRMETHGNSCTPPCTPPARFYGYITEGVNATEGPGTFGYINTETRVTKTPTDLSGFDPGDTSPTETAGQAWLYAHAETSNVDTSPGPLWEHFTMGQGFQTEPRHPGERYCDTELGANAPGCQ